MPSATSAFVQRAFARLNAVASTASHPNDRDDHDTPLWRGGLATNRPVIWVGWKQKYFSAYGWTAQIRLIPFDKFAPARTGFRGSLRFSKWEFAGSRQKRAVISRAVLTNGARRQCVKISYKFNRTATGKSRNLVMVHLIILRSVASR